MIKLNAVVVLLVACAVLAAGFLIVQSDRPVVKMAALSGLLLKNAEGPFTSVEIKKGDVTVKLERKDKEWFITSHKNRPAKVDRVMQLIGDISTAHVDNTRAGSPENFDLDPQKRTEINLTQENGTRLQLFVGKSPDWGKVFASAERDGPVGEVDRSLDVSAGVRTEGDARLLDPAYFYDLRVLSLNAGEIIGIDIQEEKSLVRLRRALAGKPVEPKQELPKDAKLEWLLTEPETAPADESAVSRITSTVTNFNAKSYADGFTPEKAHMDKPLGTVQLLMKDGSRHVLVFGAMDGEDVVLNIDNRPDLYKAYGYVYDSMVKTAKAEGLKRKDTPDKGGKSSAAPESSAPPAPVPAPEKSEAPAKPVPPKAETPPPPPAQASDTQKPEPPPAVVK